MAEYIERDALVRQISCNMAEYVGAPDDVLKHDEQCNYAISCVESAPAADVAPVAHGKWIEQEDQMLDVYYTCSVCKEDFYIETTGYTEKDMFLYTYCPNCGAKMDGDE